MENGAFALWSKCSFFHKIFKYTVRICQKLQKAVLCSKHHAFESIMEYGAFALLEQMLHFP